jgi:hypothetical protein
MVGNDTTAKTVVVQEFVSTIGDDQTVKTVGAARYACTTGFVITARIAAARGSVDTVGNSFKPKRSANTHTSIRTCPTLLSAASSSTDRREVRR